MDRRQQKTRTAIFNALSNLLAEKNYNRISVQEIIDRANVGRSTFYAHFETKDELLHELCTDLFNHVFSDSLITESTHDFSWAKDNPQAAITHILYHLRDNKRNIIGILTCDSGELFLLFFQQYVNDLLIGQMTNGIDIKKLSIPYEFLVNHISGSLVNMIQWWIKGGLKQSPEELSKYFMAVISPVLTSCTE